MIRLSWNIILAKNFNLFLYQWLAYTHGRRSILKIVSRCAAVLLLLKIVAMSSCNHHTSSNEGNTISDIELQCLLYGCALVLHSYYLDVALCSQIVDLMGSDLMCICVYTWAKKRTQQKSIYIYIYIYYIIYYIILFGTQTLINVANI